MLRHAAWIGVLALLNAAAEAKVIDARDNGMTLENQVVVPVDAATAWDGLVNHVDAWWPRDHSWFPGSRFSIEPRAGGCFCERAGARESQHMIIAFADPGSVLRMLGGLGPLQGMGLHGALEWRFETVPEGTRLTLRYVVGGYTTQDLKAFAPIVDKVQGQQLGALADFLKRRHAAPGR